MRVAVVSTGAGHTLRGVEAWAEGLSHGLRAYRDVDVHLFSGGHARHCSVERWVPCLRRNSALWGGQLSTVPRALRGVIEQYSSLPAVGLRLLLGHYDVVHTADGVVAMWLNRARPLSGKARIVFNSGASSIEFCGQFKYVDAVAEYYREQASERGIDTSGWFVNPYWVDTNSFTPASGTERGRVRKALGIPGDAFVVVSVGAIDISHKRLHYVIREIERLRAENASVFLVVAGSTVGKETEHVRKLARQRLGDNCIVLTDLPHASMPMIYRAGDLFCLASLDEVFGIAIIEGMASGLPALVHKSAVQKWIVGDGGEVVDMGQEGQLARAISLYVRGSGSISPAAARSRAVKVFSKETVIPRVVDMYRTVLGS